MNPKDYPEGFTPIYDSELLDSAREHYGKEDLTDEEVESFIEYQQNLGRDNL